MSKKTQRKNKNKRNGRKNKTVRRHKKRCPNPHCLCSNCTCGPNCMCGTKLGGSSSCGNTACPIAPLPYKGGTTFVGAPIVNGEPNVSNSNYYALNNKIAFNPATQMKLNDPGYIPKVKSGGRKRRGKGRRGGGDIGTFASDLWTNAKNVVNVMRTEPQLPSAKPFVQPKI
jgi:hypothetical protein